MSGFNFNKIAGVISEVMDTDYIDIKRNVNGELQEIYSNVKCHVSFGSVDNPDTTSVDIKPTIQQIIINLPVWVDIKNDDFIVAKKMSCDNSILAVYSGRCGTPAVSQSRKKVIMGMNATNPEPPTPIPPQNPTNIIIKYLSKDVEIKDTTTKEVEVGQSITINAPEIEGFVVINSKLDGILQNDIKVFIPSVEEYGNIVEFIYAVNEEPTSFRFLVDGIYTQDDGSLANGYHLYKPVKIDKVLKLGKTYTVSSDDVKFIHEDNGKELQIKVGVKLALMPQKIFVKVTEIVSREYGPAEGESIKVTFIADEYTPSEEEQNSYVTGWYNRGV